MCTINATWRLFQLHALALRCWLLLHSVNCRHAPCAASILQIEPGEIRMRAKAMRSRFLEWQT